MSKNLDAPTDAEVFAALVAVIKIAAARGRALREERERQQVIEKGTNDSHPSRGEECGDD